MSVISIEPRTYATASQSALSDKRRALTACNTAYASMSRCSNMAGSDDSGEKFAAGYDEAARSAIETGFDFTETIHMFARVLMGCGYLHATSDYRARGDESTPPGYVDPGEAVDVFRKQLPSASGGDMLPVPGWNLIAEYMSGLFWPSADTDKLRAAAATWTNLGQDFEAVAREVRTWRTDLAAVQSDEKAGLLADVDQLARDLDAYAAFVMGEPESLAAACEGYAEQVDNTRHESLLMLRDLVIEIAATVAISAALSVVTFGGAAAVGAGAIAIRIGFVGSRIAMLIGRLVSAAHRFLLMLNGIARKFKAFRALVEVAGKHRLATKVAFESMGSMGGASVTMFLPGNQASGITVLSAGVGGAFGGLFSSARFLNNFGGRIVSGGLEATIESGLEMYLSNGRIDSEGMQKAVIVGLFGGTVTAGVTAASGTSGSGSGSPGSAPGPSSSGNAPSFDGNSQVGPAAEVPSSTAGAEGAPAVGGGGAPTAPATGDGPSGNTGGGGAPSAPGAPPAVSSPDPGSPDVGSPEGGSPDSGSSDSGSSDSGTPTASSPDGNAANLPTVDLNPVDVPAIDLPALDVPPADLPAGAAPPVGDSAGSKSDTDGDADAAAATPPPADLPATGIPPVDAPPVDMLAPGSIPDASGLPVGDGTPPPADVDPGADGDGSQPIGDGDGSGNPYAMLQTAASAPTVTPTVPLIPIEYEFDGVTSTTRPIPPMPEIPPHAVEAGLNEGTWAHVYEQSTHNMEGSTGTAVLGGYTGETDPRSYQNVARSRDAAHFNMDSGDWNGIRDAYGLTDGEMYDIFNKPFLDEVAARGMTIDYTSDPTTPGRPDVNGQPTQTALNKEHLYATGTLGYTWDPVTNTASPPSGLTPPAAAPLPGPSPHATGSAKP